MDFEAVKLFLTFLMLALCGCSETQKASISLEKRQEAIANEIVSNYSKVVFYLSDTNNSDSVAKIDSLANRLEAISKELASSGQLSLELRKTTLEKLACLDKESLAKKKSPLYQQPEDKQKTISVLGRYVSAFGSATYKAGLYYYTTNSADTNGVELPNHP